MLPEWMKKVIAGNPKKVPDLIDLVNLPLTLREFMGQSQTSRLGCFKRVWSYIKENKLQVDITNPIYGYARNGNEVEEQDGFHSQWWEFLSPKVS